MKDEMVQTIKQNTAALFTNAGILLQTCNLDFVLCGMPVWKHAYHMLHSCDRWYINPTIYTEPDFHTPHLDSLDIEGGPPLSREELLRYLDSVRTKVMAYLDGLTDGMLYEVPEGCQSNRLGLILLQFRHFYAHLGNINGTTILETGQWPRVVGPHGEGGTVEDGLTE